MPIEKYFRGKIKCFQLTTDSHMKTPQESHDHTNELEKCK